MVIIMLSREKAIKEIFDRHGDDALYITTTGYISRAIYNIYSTKKNIFYMQGSMGLSPSIGLGIALNTKKPVVAISGDASLLMHMGITHTIKYYDLSNLFVYVLDNNCHESVGGFLCSPLEESYNGINFIYKINKEGKTDRVKLDPITNKREFMSQVGIKHND